VFREKCLPAIRARGRAVARRYRIGVTMLSKGFADVESTNNRLDVIDFRGLFSGTRSVPLAAMRFG
jgi:hypothetical protein